jgi:hypothetical protein
MNDQLPITFHSLVKNIIKLFSLTKEREYLKKIVTKDRESLKEEGRRSLVKPLKRGVNAWSLIDTSLKIEK